MDAQPRLEQLDTTLEHLERLCTRLEQAERHFKQLTDDCQGVLQGLVTVDRRHSTAVAGLNERLSDWCNLESKLLEESARRIEQFERGVSHEWMVLRQLNEEPIAEMREQADSLRRTCLEAAREARLRLEAAEQAYAAQAASLERRMIEWQRRWIDAAHSGPALAAAGGAVEPWPLEGVAQLHQEMRAAPAAGPAGAASTTAAPATVEGTGALVPTTVETPVEEEGRRVQGREPGTDTIDVPSRRRPRWHRGAAIAGAAAILIAVAGLVSGALYFRTAPTAAAAQPPAATSGTAPAATPDADRQREERLAEAQRLVERAGSMVDILAAPDLLRYGLSGTGPTTTAYAQVLWSRSRGVAVSASRLAPAPAGKSYALWVISEGQAALVGTLAPDATGRASLVVPGPLTLPRLVALRVTLEDRPDTDRPTGPTCLAGGPTS